VPACARLGILAEDVPVLPIVARGLVKRYGRIVAVEDVDLTVRVGDVDGFLGPNGAGKTTAMRMLLGLITADDGEVRLFGRDPQNELPEALDLLILDEPTNGLDPAGIRDMRSLIRELAREGMTIFLSSHLLAEVEELCDRVAIIRSGRIVYEGSLADLHATAPARYRLRTTDDVAACEVCRTAPGVHAVAVEDGAILFTADEDAVVALSRALVQRGLGIRSLAPSTATLESLFFELTETRAAA
jgi:ABC-type multidrug transport system ATPase subunit